MAAAARGEGFEIGYGGTVQYDFAPDVGVAFARAAAAATDGAHVANFPGVAASTADVVGRDRGGRARGRRAGSPGPTSRLPFPETLEAAQLERLVGPLPRTPLADGVRRTIEHYRPRS